MIPLTGFGTFVKDTMVSAVGDGLKQAALTVAIQKIQESQAEDDEDSYYEEDSSD